MAPGDSTVVELIFNTRVSKGKVSKNARVSSNDSTRAGLTIDFSANIVVDPDTVSIVRFAPSQMYFSKDTSKFTVMVQNLDSVQVNLAMLGSLGDGVTAKIKNDKIKTGKSGKLEFTWSGNAPEYDSNHVITFETGIKDVSCFSIPYTVRGTKGPKPGTVPQHATPSTVKPSTGQPSPTPNQPPKFVDEKGNIVKMLSSDSVKVPGGQWPPK